MAEDFVHLHVHSEYSSLSSTVTIDRLLDEITKKKMSAVAITDHDTLFGTAEFYTKAKQRGIKPIIGCEIQIECLNLIGRTDEPDPHPHLVLLAQNPKGYYNLVKLANTPPPVTLDKLSRLSDGLIGLSGCSRGEIPRALIEESEVEAFAAVKRYVDIFGTDSFFLELQYHGLTSQRVLIEKLVRLSKKARVPVVATNNCHYSVPEHTYATELLRYLGDERYVKPRNASVAYNSQAYIKSPEEMEKMFSEIPEALTNTMVISERCDLEMDDYTEEFTFRSDTSKSEKEEKLLVKLATEGLEQRIISCKHGRHTGKNVPRRVYKERLTRELELITNQGWVKHFLLAYDLTRLARQKEIAVGPGRGPFPSSLVAYCLKITDIDPIAHGLLAERFMNPQRDKGLYMSLDVCAEGRKNLLDYLEERYKKKHVASPPVFKSLSGDQLLEEAANQFRVRFSVVHTIMKFLEAFPDKSLKEIINSERWLQALAKKDSYAKRYMDIVIAIEGVKLYPVAHPASVIISNEDVSKHVPIFRTRNGNALVQPTDLELRRLPYYSFDVLQWKVLTFMSGVTDEIEPSIDLSTIPLDDEKTFQLLRAGNTDGIPDLSLPGAKELLRELKPGCFDQMVHFVALFRPRIMENGVVEEYISRKNGEASCDPLYPELEKIVAPTYGIILYQEQIMEILQKLAGYSLFEADLLWRKLAGLMGKDGFDLKKFRDEFTERLQYKLAHDETGKILDLLKRYAPLSLCKAHCCAYALVYYRLAYLKTHYQEAFEKITQSE